MADEELSIEVWAATSSLGEILAQHARYGEGLLPSPIRVSPRVALRLRPDAREAVEGLLAAASERTGLFLRPRGSASIELGLDLVYSDYPNYLRTLEALAPYVDDADFSLYFEQEDDAGRDYYVVDACRFANGSFTVSRRLTRAEPVTTG